VYIGVFSVSKPSEGRWIMSISRTGLSKNAGFDAFDRSWWDKPFALGIQAVSNVKRFRGILETTEGKPNSGGY
jgi:hypothetical protein